MSLLGWVVNTTLMNLCSPMNTMLKEYLKFDTSYRFEIRQAAF